MPNASNIGADDGRKTENGMVMEMAKCDACKELSNVCDASQELMTAKFTNHKTGHATFLLVQGNENPQSVKIAVNYCPWCGRYLRGDGNA